MEEEMYWVATQKVLQAVVVKPVLTPALLQKPPFRFLHDIISQVSRRSGFAKGLFPDHFLDSANIKDKEAKVAYLTSIITCVSMCLDAPVPARPLKMVAGLQPEHTNTFLQMLAAASALPLSLTQQAVRRTLASQQPPSPSPSPSPPPSPTPRHQQLELPPHRPQSARSGPPRLPGTPTRQDKEVVAVKPNILLLRDEAEEEERGVVAAAPTPAADAEPGGKREEIEKLRAAVQAVCQATTPLGKCMDKVQEGMEAMVQEQQLWHHLHHRYLLDLRQERRITADLLEAEAQARTTRLTDLQHQTHHRQQAIQAHKAQIVRNQHKITTLLRLATTTSTTSSTTTH